MGNVLFKLANATKGRYNWYSKNTWPPTNADTYVLAGQTFVIEFGKMLSGGIYYIETGYLSFDTSSLGDSDVITSAKLIVASQQSGDGDAAYSVVADYYAWEPVDSTDWISTITSSIFSPVRLNAFTTDIPYEIPLTDLTGINKSGLTQIRLGVDTGGDITPTGLNYVRFYNADPAWNALGATLLVTIDGDPTSAYSLPPARIY